MDKKQEKRISPLLLFLIISLLFHGILVSLFYLFHQKSAERSIPPESKVVWIEPQFPQIADIERPAVEKRPEKAKFVGQYDSAPKEELVARAKPRVKEVKENPLSSEERMKAAAPKQKVQPPTKTALPKTPADLNLRAEDVLKKEMQKTKEPSPQKTYAARNAAPGLSYGKPSTPDLFNHDYYPDYKVAGKTYLNVMKLQDIGYFVKMKRILKMRWNPVPSVRDYLTYNRLSMGSIECVVGVSLDDTGKVAELFVIHSSGLGAYDQEALQTIRDSSPFSAPPSQFLKEGQVRMSWTFTVYL